MLSRNKATALAELTSLSASLVSTAEAVNKVHSEARYPARDAATAICNAATKIATAIGELVDDEIGESAGDETDA